MLYSRDTTIRINIHAEIYSTIMTNEHTSIDKLYLLHFIRKGCERVVSER